MSNDPDPYDRLRQNAPRPIPQPSRPAQAALLLAGAVALALLVVQVIGGGDHGIVSGQDQSFGMRPTQPTVQRG